MRVRLGFAVAAQMEPDVLIIDEVLAVGDVAFRFKCINRIVELMRSAAVIFVSHNMHQIYRLCD
jgi:lipopolysaccharide transport system ATP-binding protein